MEENKKSTADELFGEAETSPIASLSDLNKIVEEATLLGDLAISVDPEMAEEIGATLVSVEIFEEE